MRTSLQVEIGPGPDGGLSIRVTAPDGAEAQAAVAPAMFPPDLAGQWATLAEVRRGGSARDLAAAGAPAEAHVSGRQAAEALGRALFELVFPATLRSLYHTARLASPDGARVLLRLGSESLAAWPWEVLYDPDQGEFLCLDRRTPVVRYVAADRPREPLRVPPPLRILGMTAQPTDLPQLDVAGEKARLERALAPLLAAGTLDLRWVPGPTWRHLLDETSGGGCHVFHFIGHGQAGHIALADDAGAVDLRSARDVGLLLGDLPDLRLVFLNACAGAVDDPSDPFGSVAATLVERGVPAVLAMQNAISDRAAVELARTFYEALARGQAVDEATTAGRKAILLAGEDTVEWATPVLYLRALDGVLFTPPEGHVDLDTLVRRAEDDAAAGRYAAAIEGLTAAIAQRDDDPALYYTRGQVLHQAAFHQAPEGSYAAAIADFSRAIQLDAQQAAFVYARGRSRYQAAASGDAAGDLGQAIDDFSQAIALEPDDVDAYLWRGRTHKALGEGTAADDDFEAAIRLGNDEARRELGFWRRLTGSWRSARKPPGPEGGSP